MLQQVLVTVAASIIGWCIINFVASPVLRVHALRRRVHQAIIYYTNVGEDSTKVARVAAQKALRALASELLAEAERPNSVAMIWARYRGWNFEMAGRSLNAEANSISGPQLRFEARAGVLEALKLPQWSTNIGINARIYVPSVAAE